MTEKGNKICFGTKVKPNCKNKAEWKVIGHSAGFGVPITTLACNDCKEWLESHPHPKIIAYNQFDPQYIKI